MAASPDADTKLPDNPTWMVELTPGHVAYVRMCEERQTVSTAELRIVYKDPLTAQGGDVMAFEFDFSCPDKTEESSGEVTSRKGELWKRYPAVLHSELEQAQFDALRTGPTLAKAWKRVCERWDPEKRKSAFVKVPRLSQTYFGLVDQGVHYQVAMGLANTPNNEYLEPGGPKALDISYQQWKSVAAIFKWRNLPPQEQAAP